MKHFTTLEAKSQHTPSGKKMSTDSTDAKIVCLMGC